MAIKLKQNFTGATRLMGFSNRLSAISDMFKGCLENIELMRNAACLPSRRIVDSMQWGSAKAWQECTNC